MNLKTNVTTHGTGSWLARPDLGGVVVSTPPCQEEEQADVYLPNAEYSQPYKEGPLPPVEGWLHTLIAPESMMTTKTEVDNNQTALT